MNLKDLKKFVEERLHVDKLEAEGRKNHEAYSRFVYMNVAYFNLKYGVVEIGKSLNRGHATVINGLKQYDSLSKTDRDFKRYVRERKIISSAITMHQDKSTDFLLITAKSIDELELKFSEKLAKEIFNMQKELDSVRELMFGEEIFTEVSSLPLNDKEEFKNLAKVFLKRKKKELNYHDSK